MRFFGVSSAVKAAAYVILSGREAAWEDILSGDWLPDLRAQLRRKILGRDLDGEASVDARQVAALECIDELLSVTDAQLRRGSLSLLENDRVSRGRKTIEFPVAQSTKTIEFPVAQSFSWARLLCRFRRGRRLLYRFRRELSRRRRLNRFCLCGGPCLSSFP